MNDQEVLVTVEGKGEPRTLFDELAGLLRKILEAAANQATAVEERMEQYTSRLESRLFQLPKELETGLDPPRIAKLLGESLRQSFQQSGLPATCSTLP